MSDKKIWLITGAGRGMGVDIAKAALAAGHAVVATGRNAEKVNAAVGTHDDLLVVELDVTDPAAADAAVQATVDRFGRIDVLVNNAGNFNAGFFEELRPEEFRAQIETTPVRSGQRHSCGTSGDARPAVRPGRHALLDRRHRGRGVLDRVRRLEVRGGGVDGVADT
jgi:NAD(P)-dependent dehydrogenase (short-subunit alcohol dehydrogenase family)